jgi:hypothetical protein
MYIENGWSLGSDSAFDLDFDAGNNDSEFSN